VVLLHFGNSRWIVPIWNSSDIFYGKFLTLEALSYDRLQSMQQATASPSMPSSTSPSFAGLLAALASPGEKSSSMGQKSAQPWEDDELGDDIATLSYESALRAHTRYRSAGSGENFLAQGASDLLEMLHAEEQERKPASAAAVSTAAMSTETAAEEQSISQKSSVSSAPPEALHAQLSMLDRSVKDASITIRVSKAECAQLHRRAAEAGLTVSAYLRSCTFEAESLRAMVKDTMAQLRSASVPSISAPARESWLRSLGQWLTRLLNPWQNSQRVARA
jgi:predicted DNA binding CopG/RHH family protein